MLLKRKTFETRIAWAVRDSRIAALETLHDDVEEAFQRGLRTGLEQATATFAAAERSEFERTLAVLREELSRKDADRDRILARLDDLQGRLGILVTAATAASIAGPARPTAAAVADAERAGQAALAARAASRDAEANPFQEVAFGSPDSTYATKEEAALEGSLEPIP